MDATQWQEVKRILDGASRLAPEERPTFVERACGGDAALREEVSSLLDFHDQTRTTRDALGRPVFDVNSEAPEVGRRVGHYRIVRLVGRGGMGKVYLASREDDYSKQVAIKLIQRGIDTEDRIARFHEERQILAHLDHPSIARLLDGGTMDDGLPYLVMELVEGEPIHKYCDTRRLGVRHRLELFHQVLAAVDYSHRHLVVHRDLKPGNVLVTPDGTPKLIDFGIAKLLHADGQGTAGASSRPRPRPMSPQYASPEQIRGQPVTTATDVYSLGVLLYELLSGHPPYRLDVTDPVELERAVCNATPVVPSVMVRTAGVDGGEAPSPEQVAEKRDTSPRRLAQQLSGEIDAIVTKAMCKAPEERYSSAARLADDVERYLRDLPVRAQASSLVYRARKLLWRYRKAAAVAFLALVALSATVATFVLRSHVARERVQSQAIEDWVSDLFRAAGPDRSGGQELTVLEVLDRGSSALVTDLEEYPGIRSALLGVLGRTYEDLGESLKAESLLRKALEIQRAYDPENDDAISRRANDLGVVLRQRGDLVGAEALYSEAFDRLGGCRSRRQDTVWIAGNLAWVRAEMEDFEGAETLIDCLLDRIASGTVPSNDKEMASLLTKLGAMRYREGRSGEAETLFRQALTIREVQFGFFHTKTATVLNNLGQALQAQDKKAEAEAVLRRALDIRRKVLGDDHADTVNTEENLSRVLDARRR